MVCAMVENNHTNPNYLGVPFAKLYLLHSFNDLNQLDVNKIKLNSDSMLASINTIDSRSPVKYLCVTPLLNLAKNNELVNIHPLHSVLWSKDKAIVLEKTVVFIPTGEPKINTAEITTIQYQSDSDQEQNLKNLISAVKIFFQVIDAPLFQNLQDCWFDQDDNRMLLDYDGKAAQALAQYLNVPLRSENNFNKVYIEIRQIHENVSELSSELVAVENLDQHQELLEKKQQTLVGICQNAQNALLEQIDVLPKHQQDFYKKVIIGALKTIIDDLESKVLEWKKSANLLFTHDYNIQEFKQSSAPVATIQTKNNLYNHYNDVLNLLKDFNEGNLLADFSRLSYMLVKKNQFLINGFKELNFPDNRYPITKGVDLYDFYKEAPRELRIMTYKNMYQLHNDTDVSLCFKNHQSHIKEMKDAWFKEAENFIDRFADLSKSEELIETSDVSKWLGLQQNALSILKEQSDFIDRNFRNYIFTKHYLRHIAQPPQSSLWLLITSKNNFVEFDLKLVEKEQFIFSESITNLISKMVKVIRRDFDQKQTPVPAHNPTIASGKPTRFSMPIQPNKISTPVSTSIPDPIKVEDDIKLKAKNQATFSGLTIDIVQEFFNDYLINNARVMPKLIQEKLTTVNFADACFSKMNLFLTELSQYAPNYLMTEDQTTYLTYSAHIVIKNDTDIQDKRNDALNIFTDWIEQLTKHLLNFDKQYSDILSNLPKTEQLEDGSDLFNQLSALNADIEHFFGDQLNKVMHAYQELWHFQFDEDLRIDRSHIKQISDLKTKVVQETNPIFVQAYLNTKKEVLT